jgi:hypothetical protein
MGQRSRATPRTTRLACRRRLPYYSSHAMPCHQSRPPDPAWRQHLSFPREPPPASGGFCARCGYGSEQMFQHGSRCVRIHCPPFPSTIPRMWLILAVRSDQSHPKIVTPGQGTRNRSSRSWCACTLASSFGPPLTGRTRALKLPPLR